MEIELQDEKGDKLAENAAITERFKIVLSLKGSNLDKIILNHEIEIVPSPETLWNEFKKENVDADKLKELDLTGLNDKDTWAKVLERIKTLLKDKFETKFKKTIDEGLEIELQDEKGDKLAENAVITERFKIVLSLKGSNLDKIILNHEIEIVPSPETLWNEFKKENVDADKLKELDLTGLNDKDTWAKVLERIKTLLKDKFETKFKKTIDEGLEIELQDEKGDKLAENAVITERFKIVLSLKGSNLDKIILNHEIEIVPSPETLWNEFKKENVDADKLKELDLTGLNDKDTWAKVLERIKTLLKDKFETKFKKTIDEGLEIELQDEKGDKLAENAVITERFKIVLSLKGSNLDKIILNHEIEIAPSPETLWNEFKKENVDADKLKELDLTGLNDKDIWAKVLERIKTLLKDKFETKFKKTIDEGLEIELQDEKGDKLAENAAITERFKIVLSLKGSNLDKIILNHEIEIVPSPETLWNEFKKENVDADKLKELDLTGLNDKDTWAKVLERIKTLLKDKFETKFKKTIDEGLEIELQDEKGDKLAENAVITERFKIVLSLKGSNLDKIILNHEIEIVPSPETLWNEFKKENVDADKLKELDLTGLNDKDIWAKVLERIKTLLKDKFETKFKKTIDEGLEIELQDEKGDKLAENAVITERFKIVLSLKGSNLDKIILNHEIEIVPSPETLWNEFKKENVDADKLKELDLTGLNDKDTWAKVLERIKTLLKDKFETKFKKTIDEGLEIELQDEKGDKLAENAVITERFKIVLSLKGSNLDKIILNHEIEIVPSPETLWNEFKKENVDADKLKELDLTGLNDKDIWAKVLERIKTLLKDKFETKFKKTIDEGLEIELQDEKGDKLAENAVITERFKIVLSLKGSNLDKIILNHEIEIVPSPETLWNEFKKENVDADKLKELDLTGLNDKDIWAKVLERIKTLLKDKFETKFKKTIDEGLEIELQDEKGDKLAENAVITERFKIVLSLKGSNLDKIILNHEIEIVPSPETLWNEFKKENVDADKLKELDLTGLNDKDTWAKVLERIKTLLKDKFETKFKKTIDEGLEIELQDEKGDKLAENAVITERFKIVLSLKGSNLDKIILNHEIEIVPSPETLWNEFKKENVDADKLKELDLTGLNDKDIWAKVLERIKTLLKDKFETKFKKTIDEGLEIELQDEKGDKLAENAVITERFKIVLSLKGSNLDKIILNHEIEIVPSPETLWNEFKKENVDADKLKELDLTGLNDKDIWAKVLERIKTLLKDKFETKFKKTIDEGLEIELQDEKGDKLAENAVITERFKIVLSLKGSNLDKIILNHEIEIVPSPETLWNEFKKENVDADKLKELDLTGLNDKDIWAKVLERIKTLLKDKFETKFKKTIDEGLEIELQDEKGDKLAENAVITERFKIVLSLKGSNLDKIILNHEIEIVPSPETLWNEFKKENVDADKLKELDLTGLNDKDIWAKVLERIKTLLKDKFETKFKKTIDEGLEIELQDEKGDKLAENAVITERFKIVLSLKGSNLDKIILNHEIEIAPSPETLWNEFKKENVDADKLKELDLTGLNDKDIWAKVLERIKTLLKDKFETKFKKTIDEGLEIELQDEKGDKLAENAVITERFKIVLSLKGSNLDKIILNHEIEIVPSPETLWNEFKKENVDADKLKELDLTGLNDKDIWAKVLERIKTLLKDKFETKFKKTIDEGLEIELQDEKGDKLAENAVITERFKIVLSLKGSNLDKIILNHEIEIVPSPETLWNEFKKENVDADKLKELDLTGLNDKDIWAKVLERIKTLLKDKFETKFKKTIDEGLEIELQDEKGDKLAENAVITERFKIVLSLKGSNLDKIILNHEIEIVPSPETLWNEFKKENVDADKLKELDLTGLNDKDIWAKVLERIKTLLKDKFETKFKKTIDEGLEIELQDEKGDKLAENAVITERFKIVLSLKGSNLDKIILNHEIEIVPSPETLWNEFKKENVDADKLKELDLTGLNDKDIWAKVLERIKTLLKDKFETKFKKTIDEGLEIELQDEKGDKLAENAVITERFKIVLSLKGSNLDKIILNHEIEIVPSPETLWNEFKKENVDADKLKELDLTGLNDKDIWAKVLERIKTLLKDKFETKFKKTIDEGLEIELQDEKGDKLAENAVITERFKIVLSLKGSNLDKIILNHEIEIVPSPETLWNEFKKENVDADKLKELDLTGLNDKDIWAKVLERIKTLLKDKFETKFKKTIDEGLEIELQDEKGDKLAENAVITERFKIVLSLKGSNLDKIILNHEIEIAPSPETLWNEFKKENVDADKLKELDLTGLNDKDIWAKVLERIKTLLKDKFETKFKKTIDEGLEIELQDEKGDKLAENAVITERFKIVLSLKGSNLDKIILNHEIEIAPSPETLWNEFKKENVDADKLKELDLTGLNDKDTWAKVLERIKTLLKDKFETKFKKTIDEGLEIELQDEKGDKLAENAVITERFKIVLSLKGSNLDKIILNHEIEIVPSPETLWNEFKKENVDADKLKELDLTGLNDKDIWAKVLERIKTLLKDKFETKFKKTIDEGLEIELQDEKGDKLAENAVITERFKIVLSLKGSNLDKIILNHEIEIVPSPETLWNEFKKENVDADKLKELDLTGLNDKDIWAKVLERIKTLLKDKFETKFKKTIDEGLEIELQDEKGDKLAENAVITERFKIVLSLKGSNLDKIILNHEIEIVPSPETLWNEFKKENVDADKLKELDLTGLNDKDIWAKVLERIKTLLKDKFETKFKKTIDEGLEIELQDEKGDKLAENAVITERFKIVLSLKGSNLDKIILNHEIEIVPSPETLWNEFKKENVDADKLKELDLTGLNDKDIWAKVLERIKTLLKDKFETKFKKTIDEGLEIELQDEKGDKLAENAVITERFKIVLSLKGSNLDKIILNHEIEIVPSPETLWNEFKKENVDADKLKELDLTGLNDKDIWAKVLERIKTLLKDKFETKFKKTIDEGLEIELQDEKGDKLAENAVITERFKIVLSLKGSNLDKIILNHEIEIVPSPETLWNEFKKENVDADKLKELDLTGLNDKDIWAKVLERIKTLLKDKFETKFKKTIDEGLEIELQDEKGDKLAENAVITERFKIVLSLKGSNLDKIILNHEIEIVPSPETLWNEFKKENVDADKLKELDLTGLNDKDTWAKVLERIKTLLKDKFETKFKKTIDEGLEIELQDEKGDKLAENAVITERFKIVLSLKGSNLDKIILNHEIEIVPSPETLWNEFKKENVDADKLKELDLTGLNDKDTWAKVLERIKTLLKDKFETKFKKTIDEGLEIELQDEKGDKLAENAVITERFKIVLSLKGSNLDKIILNHEIEIAPSPETLWNEFKKENVDADKLKELDLTGLNDKDTWDKVLERIKTLLKDKFETKFKKTIDEGLEIELQDEKGDKLAENAVITERFKIVLSLKGSNLDKIILNHEIEIAPSPETLWNEFKKENVDADKLKELDLTGLNDKDTWAKVLERIKTLLKDKFETKFKKTIDEGLEIELQDEKGDKLAENAAITERFKIVLSLKGSNLDKIILNHEIEIAPSPETLWNEFKKENVDADKLKELDLTGLNDKDIWAKVLERIKTLLKDKFETKFKKTIDEGLEIELQDEKGDKLAENAVITERFKIVLSLKGSNLDKIILNHEIEIVPSPETLWNEFKKENVDADKLKELDLTGLNDKDIWAKVLERIKTLLKDKFETKFKKTIDEGLEIELQDEKGDKLAENAVITERFKIVLSLKGSNLDKIILNHEIEIVPSPETLWNEFKKENVDADKLKELDLTGLNDKDIWAKVLERIKTLLKDKFETKFKKTIDEGLEIELQDEKGDKLAENAVITERFKIVLSLKGSNLDKIILNHEIEIVPSPETLWNEFKKENVDADKLKELDLTGLNDKDIWAKVLERIKTLLKDKFETKFKKTIDEGLEIELQDEKGDKLAENAVITERFKIVLSLKGSNLDKIILNHEIEIVPSPETLWNEFKKENVDADKLKELDLTGLNDKDIWAKVLERIKTLLKDKFETKFKKTIDEGLEIELQDEKGDKLAENAVITERFKIVLSLKGSNLDKIILNHEIEIVPSPETLWNEFKKENVDADKLKELDLTGLNDKDIWAKVLERIKTLLKDKFETKFKKTIDEGLEIELQDEKGDKLAENAVITERFKIVLSLKGSNLDKIILNHEIEIVPSPETLWNEFKKENVDADKLKELDLTGLNDKDIWAKVLERIKTLLKDKFETKFKKTIDEGLEIELQDEKGDKLAENAVITERFKIVLSLKGSNLDKIILNHEIEIVPSPETLWNEFKKENVDADKLKELDLTGLNDKDIWAKVLERIKTLLKDKFETKFKKTIDEGLEIELQDEKGDKLAENAVITERFKIVLSLKGSNLDKIILNHEIEIVPSPETLWNEFKKENVDADKLKELDLTGLNDKDIWAKVLERIKTLLKDKFETKFKKTIDEGLEIELQDEKGDKLAENAVITERFKIVLSLKGSNLDKIILNHEIEIAPSPETLWNEFKKENVDADKLKELDLTGLNDKDTWAKVLERIKTLLKDKFETKFKKTIDEGLEIELQDEKGDKLAENAVITERFKIVLSLKGSNLDKIILNHEIEIAPSPETLWNEFKKENVDADKLKELDLTGLNDKDTWAKVLERIKTLLKDKFETKFKKTIDEGLEIELQDEKGDKLAENAVITERFKIVLSLKGSNLDKIILNHEIEIAPSPETLWNEFKKENVDADKLKELDLTGLNDKDTWAKVLERIKTLLKDKFETKFKKTIDEGLEIELQDEKGDKLAENAAITERFKIVLSLKGSNLDKIILNHEIEIAPSPETLWNAFIEAIINKDNKFIGVNLVDWLDKKHTWKDLQDYIKDQLKQRYQDEYQLDNWVNNLDIKLFDEKKQEVIYNKLITKTNDYLIKTKIFVKVIHNKLDKVGKEASIDSFQLSEKARWNAFCFELMKSMDFEEYRNVLLEYDEDTTWNDVKNSIKIAFHNELKDKLNKFGLDANNIDIQLDEKIKELNNKIVDEYEKTKDLKIKISYRNFENKIELIAKELKLTHTAKWKVFVKEIISKKPLDSIDWKQFEDGQEWEAVRKVIREKLKDTLKKVDIHEDFIGIGFFDKDGKPLTYKIDYNYTIKPSNIIIKLVALGLETKLEEPINISNFQVSESLESRWNSFTKWFKTYYSEWWKHVRRFKTGENWEDLAGEIKTQLIQKWNSYNLGDIANLKIKVKNTSNEELTGKIFEEYAKSGKKIRISITYESQDFPDATHDIEFKAISSLEEYVKRVENQKIGDITYNFKYKISPNSFIEDYKKLINKFFEKFKLGDQIPDYEIVTNDFNFEVGEKDISIRITYLGSVEPITLRLVTQKLNLSKYKINNIIKHFLKPKYDETAFNSINVDNVDIIRAFVKELKDKFDDFKGIDVDKYIKLFDIKNKSDTVTGWPGRGTIYKFHIISNLENVEGETPEITFDVIVKSVELENLVISFLNDQKKKTPDLFNLEINNNHEFWFNESGDKKTFDQIKKQYEKLIANKMKSILKDSTLWFAKTLEHWKIPNDFEFDNFNFTKDFDFEKDELKFDLEHKSKIEENSSYTFSTINIISPLKISFTNKSASKETYKKLREDLDKHKETHKLKEGMMKEDKKEIDKNYSVQGLMNDEINDWVDIKTFIDRLFTRNIELFKDGDMKWSSDFSNSKNGYFYYSTNKNIVLNVKVDKYNNNGNYKDAPKAAFSTGELKFNIWYLTNNNKLYGYGDEFTTNFTYKLVNKVEYEWYAKFRSKLDNPNGYKNTFDFSNNQSWNYATDWISKNAISWWSPTLWETYDANFVKFENRDYFVYRFGIETKKYEKHHGLKYVLKLGGTGDLAKVARGKANFLDWNLLETLKENNLKKIDLKFSLYRSNDPKNVDEESLLPIGKFETYAITSI